MRIGILTTASFSRVVGSISASDGMPFISPLLGSRVKTIHDGLMIAGARSRFMVLDRPWPHGLKSSDAMTVHGCSIRKPLMGHWRISSAGLLAITSVRDIWRRDARWPVRGECSQVHRGPMLRSCRTCQTGSKRPGKRERPPRRVEIGALGFAEGGPGYARPV